MMDRESYSRYIDSPAWKARRTQRLRRAGHQCEMDIFEGGKFWRCHERIDLNVHHISYANIGNEKPEDLKVLCWEHHVAAHLVDECLCESCGDNIFQTIGDAVDLIRDHFDAKVKHSFMCQVRPKLATFKLMAPSNCDSCSKNMCKQ